MKTWIAAALTSLALASAGCGPQVETYNQALDADRSAREKMSAALALMAEAVALQESGLTEAVASAETKKLEALGAYREAVAGWDEAKRLYNDLVSAEPENGDLHNNLGDMIYFKIMSGLEGDYGGARTHLEKAISIADRPIYRRNLELLTALSKEEDAGNISSMGAEDHEAEARRIYQRMQENRKLVALLKQVDIS